MVFYSTITIVPDPKLFITDPDPQIYNQEFRIRILPKVQVGTVLKKNSRSFTLVEGTNELTNTSSLRIFTYFARDYEEFAHCLGHFKEISIVEVKEGRNRILEARYLQIRTDSDPEH